jgi:hypothetical protein
MGLMFVLLENNGMSLPYFDFEAINSQRLALLNDRLHQPNELIPIRVVELLLRRAHYYFSM